MHSCGCTHVYAWGIRDYAHICECVHMLRSEVDSSDLSIALYGIILRKSEPGAQLLSMISDSSDYTSEH